MAIDLRNSRLVHGPAHHIFDVGHSHWLEPRSQSEGLIRPFSSDLFDGRTGGAERQLPASSTRVLRTLTFLFPVHPFQFPLPVLATGNPLNDGVVEAGGVTLRLSALSGRIYSSPPHCTSQILSPTNPSLS